MLMPSSNNEAAVLAKRPPTRPSGSFEADRQQQARSPKVSGSKSLLTSPGLLRGAESAENPPKEAYWSKSYGKGPEWTRMGHRMGT